MKSLLYDTLTGIVTAEEKLVQRVSGITINGLSSKFLAADGAYYTINTSASSANDSQIKVKVGSGNSVTAFTLNQSTSGQITIPSATLAVQGVVKVTSSVVSGDNVNVPTNKAVYDMVGNLATLINNLI